MFPNQEKFLEEYKKQLIISITANPEQYSWTIDTLEEVFGRMKAAIIRGSFNKDTPAFKRTCKVLKIKHTYRDIETFLKGGV